MKILIGAEKGGTGKTTIATNLAAMRAAEGRDVLLLSADAQGSATHWSRKRDENKITPIIYNLQKTGRINSEIEKLTKKFDDIIIDVGGSDSPELRSAMLSVDKFYVFIQPSSYDIWTIPDINAIVGKVKTLNWDMKAYIVLNKVSTNPSISEVDEAREILQDLEHLTLSAVIIRDRIAFRKAARDGLSVTEMEKPDPKAVSEITALYEEIYAD